MKTILNYEIQTTHDGRLMVVAYPYDRLDDFGLFLTLTTFVGLFFLVNCGFKKKRFCFKRFCKLVLVN